MYCIILCYRMLFVELFHKQCVLDLVWPLDTTVLRKPFLITYLLTYLLTPSPSLLPSPPPSLSLSLSLSPSPSSSSSLYHPPFFPIPQDWYIFSWHYSLSLLSQLQKFLTSYWAKDTVLTSGEQVCGLLFSTIILLSVELKELVEIHGQTEKDNEEPLSKDEVLIVKVWHHCSWCFKIFISREFLK